MNFALAGAVSSTRVVFERLLAAHAPLRKVFALAPCASANVSGYEDLCAPAGRAGIDFSHFHNINEPAIVADIRSRQIDYLFVVGLSQLVGRDLLQTPRLGCIGFHPTRLPQGRGRAPIAWIILDRCPAAATLFLLDEGADSGPILAQVPFDVGPDDYASDVLFKNERALALAMDDLIPRLLAGQANPQLQDGSQATYYAKRAPEDGLIDWNSPAQQLYPLIRASSRPHPGAFTFHRGKKLIVWQARPEFSLRMRGVPGRIVAFSGDGWPIVQTADGLLALQEWALEDGSSPALKVGAKLGFDPQILFAGLSNSATV